MTPAMLGASRSEMFIARYAICLFICHSVLLLTVSTGPSSASAFGSYDPESVYPEVAAAVTRSRALQLLQNNNPDPGGDIEIDKDTIQVEEETSSSTDVVANISRGGLTLIRKRRPSHSALYKVRPLSSRLNVADQQGEILDSLLSKYKLQPHTSSVKRGQAVGGNSSMTHNVTEVKLVSDSNVLQISHDVENASNLKPATGGIQTNTSTENNNKPGARLPSSSPPIYSIFGPTFSDVSSDNAHSGNSPLVTMSDASQEMLETHGSENHSRSVRWRKLGRLSSLDPERRKAIMEKRNRIKERRKLLLRGQGATPPGDDPFAAANVTAGPAVTTKAIAVTTKSSRRDRNVVGGSGGGGRLRTNYKSERQRARGRVTKAPTTDAPVLETTPVFEAGEVPIQPVQGKAEVERRDEFTKKIDEHVHENTREKEIFRNNELKAKMIVSEEKWGSKKPQHPVFKRIKLPIDIDAPKKVKGKPYQSSEDLRNPPNLDYLSYDELYDPAPPGPRYTTKPSAVIGKNSNSTDTTPSRYKTVTRSPRISSSSSKKLPEASNTDSPVKSAHSGFNENSNPEGHSEWVGNTDSSGKTFGGVIPYFPHPRFQVGGVPQIPQPQIVSPSHSPLLPHLSPVRLVSGLVEHGGSLPSHSVRAPLVPRPVSIGSSPPVYYPESTRSHIGQVGLSLPHHSGLEDYETDDLDHGHDSFDHDQESFRFDHNSFEQDPESHDNRDSSHHGHGGASPVSTTLDRDVSPDPLYDAMFNSDLDQEHLNGQGQLEEIRNFRHGHNEEEHQDYDDDETPDHPHVDREPVQYGYRVASADTGNYQQRNERREGKKVKGSYQVALPDGRIQTVNYIADDAGFRAEVTYENINAIESSTPYPPSVTTSWPANSPSLAPSHPSLSNSLLPEIRHSSRLKQNQRLVSGRPPILPPVGHDRRLPASVGATTPIVPLQRPTSAVTERPVFQFDLVTRTPTIRPPTRLPSRDRPPPVHFPSPVHDGRHVAHEVGRGQDGQHISQKAVHGQDHSTGELPLPLTTPETFPQSRPWQNFANDWRGDFTLVHNNQQHRPVKPAPVKISFNNPNGIPFYPGINLPQGLQHDQLSDRPVRPLSPSIDLPPVSTSHSSGSDVAPQPHRTQNDGQTPRPHARKSPARSKPSKFSKGQIDFQEHIHVTTPSPNPFRVTLSGNMDKVRPRTTSRGRIISVSANNPTTRVHESTEEHTVESRKAESSKSLQSLEEQPREQQDEQLDHRLDDVLEFYLATTTTPSSASRDPFISAVSPNPVQLSIPSPRQISQQSSLPVHHTTVYVPGTSPPRQTLPTTESLALTTPTSSSVPLHERFSARNHNPPVFPPSLPDHSPKSRPPQLFHYESEVESSRESRERATLYNPNSPIFLKALGKSRSVPLLLPYPQDDQLPLLTEENVRSPRFIPYEFSRNISNRASPILSPIPIYSLLDR